MPRQKDLKRIIRARMQKTGEAYTTARSQITRKPVNDATAAETAAPDYASLAGMSDESISAKTGRNWEQWVRELDSHGGEQLAHKDIAALVHGGYGVEGWWSQTVTVGYERIKGLRDRGQRRGGAFEAGKSKTYNVPVDVLFQAWSDEAIRRRWLKDEGVTVRTETAPRTMRLGWPDGSIVALWFLDKGAGKSSVALAHQKLESRAASDRAKREWSERLDALGEVLAGGN